MKIAELVNFAVKQNASDLHLTPEQAPVLRIHGRLTPIRVSALSANDISQILNEIIPQEDLYSFKKHKSLNSSVSIENYRLRVNCFETIKGPSAVLRVMNNKLMSLEELGAPEAIKNLCHRQRGLILVAGPNNSGKTTTMASMLELINHTMSKHIITIENPIEYMLKPSNSIINQYQLGFDESSFKNAIDRSLKQDPDVIGIGNLTDPATIKSALVAAENGLLVFAAINSSSAAITIDRIIDHFQGEEKTVIRNLLASNLEAIICQQLIISTDYSSRVAAFEVLIANQVAKIMMRTGRTDQLNSVMQVNRKSGMIQMKDSISKLINDGVVDNSEAKQLLNRIALTEEVIYEKAATSTIAKKENYGGGAAENEF
ncbi:MAG: PilT/PilU family type 4a pilus ATPase [Pseudomonadota bacterium]